MRAEYAIKLPNHSSAKYFDAFSPTEIFWQYRNMCIFPCNFVYMIRDHNAKCWNNSNSEEYSMLALRKDKKRWPYKLRRCKSNVFRNVQTEMD